MIYCESIVAKSVMQFAWNREELEPFQADSPNCFISNNKESLLCLPLSTLSDRRGLKPLTFMSEKTFETGSLCSIRDRSGGDIMIASVGRIQGESSS